MIKHKKSQAKLGLRIVALFTAAIFLFTDTVMADGGNLASSFANLKKSSHGRIQFSQEITATSLEQMVLPESIGQIKKMHRGRSNNIVVHIQDAHSNEHAQRNISAILDYFAEHHGMKLVNLEGAEGDLQTGLFTIFPNQEARKNVADYFLREGRLTGAEHLAIVHRPELKLYGVEDTDLYQKNRNAYLDALEVKGRDLKIIEELEKAINDLARFIFLPEIRELNRRREEFQDGGRELVAYVRYLVEMAEKNNLALYDYPGMHYLLELIDLEKQIDFEKAEAEIDNLATDLKKLISRERLSRFLTNTVQFRMKKMKRSDYYGYLEQEIENAPVPVQASGQQETQSIQEKYDNVLKYLRYMRLYDGIDISIFDEITVLERVIKNKLFSSQEEVALDRIFRIVEIYKKMFNFSLTKDDANFFYAYRDEFDAGRFRDFLEPLLKQYHFSYGLPSQLEVIDRDLERVERFYAAAITRDQILIEKAVKKMESENHKVSAIVTGGFHTPGIEEYLQEHNYSYLVITPRIEEVDQERESKLYERALRRKPLPIQELLVESYFPPQSGMMNDPRFQLAFELLVPTDGIEGLVGEDALVRSFFMPIVTESHFLNPNPNTVLGNVITNIESGADLQLQAQDRQSLPDMMRLMLGPSVYQVRGSRRAPVHYLFIQHPGSRYVDVYVTLPKDKIGAVRTELNLRNRVKTPLGDHYLLYGRVDRDYLLPSIVRALDQSQVNFNQTRQRTQISQLAEAVGGVEIAGDGTGLSAEDRIRIAEELAERMAKIAALSEVEIARNPRAIVARVRNIRSQFTTISRSVRSEVRALSDRLRKRFEQAKTKVDTDMKAAERRMQAVVDDVNRVKDEIRQIRTGVLTEISELEQTLAVFTERIGNHTGADQWQSILDDLARVQARARELADEIFGESGSLAAYADHKYLNQSRSQPVVEAVEFVRELEDRFSNIADATLEHAEAALKIVNLRVAGSISTLDGQRGQIAGEVTEQHRTLEEWDVFIQRATSFEDETLVQQREAITAETSPFLNHVYFQTNNTGNVAEEFSATQAHVTELGAVESRVGQLVDQVTQAQIQAESRVDDFVSQFRNLNNEFEARIIEVEAQIAALQALPIDLTTASGRLIFQERLAAMESARNQVAELLAALRGDETGIGVIMADIQADGTGEKRYLFNKDAAVISANVQLTERVDRFESSMNALFQEEASNGLTVLKTRIDELTEDVATPLADLSGRVERAVEGFESWQGITAESTELQKTSVQLGDVVEELVSLAAQPLLHIGEAVDGEIDPLARQYDYVLASFTKFNETSEAIDGFVLQVKGQLQRTGEEMQTITSQWDKVADDFMLNIDDLDRRISDLMPETLSAEAPGLDEFGQRAVAINQLSEDIQAALDIGLEAIAKLDRSLQTSDQFRWYYENEPTVLQMKKAAEDRIERAFGELMGRYEQLGATQVGSNLERIESITQPIAIDYRRLEEEWVELDGRATSSARDWADLHTRVQLLQTQAAEVQNALHDEVESFASLPFLQTDDDGEHAFVARARTAEAQYENGLVSWIRALEEGADLGRRAAEGRVEQIYNLYNQLRNDTLFTLNYLDTLMSGLELGIPTQIDPTDVANVDLFENKRAALQDVQARIERLVESVETRLPQIQQTISGDPELQFHLDDDNDGPGLQRFIQSVETQIEARFDTLLGRLEGVTAALTGFESGIEQVEFELSESARDLPPDDLIFATPNNIESLVRLRDAALARAEEAGVQRDLTGLATVTVMAIAAAAESQQGDAEQRASEMAEAEDQARSAGLAEIDLLMVTPRNVELLIGIREEAVQRAAAAKVDRDLEGLSISAINAVAYKAEQAELAAEQRRTQVSAAVARAREAGLVDIDIFWVTPENVVSLIELYDAAVERAEAAGVERDLEGLPISSINAIAFQAEQENAVVEARVQAQAAAESRARENGFIDIDLVWVTPENVESLIALRAAAVNRADRIGVAACCEGLSIAAINARAYKAEQKASRVESIRLAEDRARREGVAEIDVFWVTPENVELVIGQRQAAIDRAESAGVTRSFDGLSIAAINSLAHQTEERNEANALADRQAEEAGLTADDVMWVTPANVASMIQMRRDALERATTAGVERDLTGLSIVTINAIAATAERNNAERIQRETAIARAERQASTAGLAPIDVFWVTPENVSELIELRDQMRQRARRAGVVRPLEGLSIAAIQAIAVKQEELAREQADQRRKDRHVQVDLIVSRDRAADVDEDQAERAEDRQPVQRDRGDQLDRRAAHRSHDTRFRHVDYEDVAAMEREDFQRRVRRATRLALDYYDRAIAAATSAEAHEFLTRADEELREVGYVSERGQELLDAETLAQEAYQRLDSQENERTEIIAGKVDQALQFYSSALTVASLDDFNRNVRFAEAALLDADGERYPLTPRQSDQVTVAIKYANARRIVMIATVQDAIQAIYHSLHPSNRAEADHRMDQLRPRTADELERDQLIASAVDHALSFYRNALTVEGLAEVNAQMGLAQTALQDDEGARYPLTADLSSQIASAAAFANARKIVLMATVPEAIDLVFSRLHENNRAEATTRRDHLAATPVELAPSEEFQRRSARGDNVTAETELREGQSVRVERYYDAASALTMVVEITEKEVLNTAVEPNIIQIRRNENYYNVVQGTREEKPAIIRDYFYNNNDERRLQATDFRQGVHGRLLRTIKRYQYDDGSFVGAADNPELISASYLRKNPDAKSIQVNFSNLDSESGPAEMTVGSTRDRVGDALTPKLQAMQQQGEEGVQDALVFLGIETPETPEELLQAPKGVTLSEKATYRGNQDFGRVNPGLRYSIVADGVGGGPEGARAAVFVRQAMDEVVTEARVRTAQSPADIVELLGEAATRARQLIVEYAADDAAKIYMGATLSIIAQWKGSAVGVSIGDSPVYRRTKDASNQPVVERLNATDDSYVSRFVGQGLTPLQAEVHAARGVLADSVSPKDPKQTSQNFSNEGFFSAHQILFVRQVLPGDIFIVLSDGISDNLGRERAQTRGDLEEPLKTELWSVINVDPDSKALDFAQREAAPDAAVEFTQTDFIQGTGPILGVDEYLLQVNPESPEQMGNELIAMADAVRRLNPKTEDSRAKDDDLTVSILFMGGEPAPGIEIDMPVAPTTVTLTTGAANFETDRPVVSTLAGTASVSTEPLPADPEPAVTAPPPSVDQVETLTARIDALLADFEDIDYESDDNGAAELARISSEMEAAQQELQQFRAAAGEQLDARSEVRTDEAAKPTDLTAALAKAKAALSELTTKVTAAEKAIEVGDLGKRLAFEIRQKHGRLKQILKRLNHLKEHPQEAESGEIGKLETEVDQKGNEITESFKQLRTDAGHPEYPVEGGGEPKYKHIKYNAAEFAPVVTLESQVTETVTAISEVVPKIDVKIAPTATPSDEVVAQPKPSIEVPSASPSSQTPTSPEGTTVTRKVQWHMKSIKSNRKSVNQDAVFVDPGIGLSISSDGLGARPAGDLASKLVVQGVREHVNRKSIAEAESAEDIQKLLLQGAQRARALMEDHVKGSNDKGMGATLAASVIWYDPALEKYYAITLNIGDSAVYLRRANPQGSQARVQQLSLSDSLPSWNVRGLVDELGGQKVKISKSQAEIHPERKVVADFVGYPKEPGSKNPNRFIESGKIQQYSSAVYEVDEGDLLITATDGLDNLGWNRSNIDVAEMEAITGPGNYRQLETVEEDGNMIPALGIEEILEKAETAQDATDGLVNMATLIRDQGTQEDEGLKLDTRATDDDISVTAMRVPLSQLTAESRLPSEDKDKLAALEAETRGIVTRVKSTREFARNVIKEARLGGEKVGIAGIVASAGRGDFASVTQLKRIRRDIFLARTQLTKRFQTIHLLREALSVDVKKEQFVTFDRNLRLELEALDRGITAIEEAYQASHKELRAAVGQLGQVIRESQAALDAAEVQPADRLKHIGALWGRKEEGQQETKGAAYRVREAMSKLYQLEPVMEPNQRRRMWNSQYDWNTVLLRQIAEHVVAHISAVSQATREPKVLVELREIAREADAALKEKNRFKNYTRRIDPRALDLIRGVVNGMGVRKIKAGYFTESVSYDDERDPSYVIKVYKEKELTSHLAYLDDVAKDFGDFFLPAVSVTHKDGQVIVKQPYRSPDRLKILNAVMKSNLSPQQKQFIHLELMKADVHRHRKAAVAVEVNVTGPVREDRKTARLHDFDNRPTNQVIDLQNGHILSIDYGALNVVMPLPADQQPVATGSRPLELKRSEVRQQVYQLGATGLRAELFSYWFENERVYRYIDAEDPSGESKLSEAFTVELRSVGYFPLLFEDNPDAEKRRERLYQLFEVYDAAYGEARETMESPEAKSHPPVKQAMDNIHSFFEEAEYFPNETLLDGSVSLFDPLPRDQFEDHPVAGISSQMGHVLRELEEATGDQTLADSAPIAADSTQTGSPLKPGIQVPSPSDSDVRAVQPSAVPAEAFAKAIRVKGAAKIFEIGASGLADRAKELVLLEGDLSKDVVVVVRDRGGQRINLTRIEKTGFFKKSVRQASESAPVFPGDGRPLTAERFNEMVNLFGLYVTRQHLFERSDMAGRVRDAVVMDNGGREFRIAWPANPAFGDADMAGYTLDTTVDIMPDAPPVATRQRWAGDGIDVHPAVPRTLAGFSIIGAASALLYWALNRKPKAEEGTSDEELPGFGSGARIGEEPDEPAREPADVPAAPVEPAPAVEEDEPAAVAEKPEVGKPPVEAEKPGEAAPPDVEPPEVKPPDVKPPDVAPAPGVGPGAGVPGPGAAPRAFNTGPIRDKGKREVKRPDPRDDKDKSIFVPTLKVRGKTIERVKDPQYSKKVGKIDRESNHEKRIRDLSDEQIIELELIRRFRHKTRDLTALDPTTLKITVNLNEKARDWDRTVKELRDREKKPGSAKKYAEFHEDNPLLFDEIDSLHHTFSELMKRLRIKDDWQRRRLILLRMIAAAEDTMKNVENMDEFNDILGFRFTNMSGLEIPKYEGLQNTEWIRVMKENDKHQKGLTTIPSRPTVYGFILHTAIASIVNESSEEHAMRILNYDPDRNVFNGNGNLERIRKFLPWWSISGQMNVFLTQIGGAGNIPQRFRRVAFARGNEINRAVAEASLRYFLYLKALETVKRRLIFPYADRDFIRTFNAEAKTNPLLAEEMFDRFIRHDRVGQFSKPETMFGLFHNYVLEDGLLIRERNGINFWTGVDGLGRRLKYIRFPLQRELFVMGRQTSRTGRDVQIAVADVSDNLLAADDFELITFKEWENERGQLAMQDRKDGNWPGENANVRRQEAIDKFENEIFTPPAKPERVHEGHLTTIEEGLDEIHKRNGLNYSGGWFPEVYNKPPGPNENPEGKQPVQPAYKLMASMVFNMIFRTNSGVKRYKSHSGDWNESIKPFLQDYEAGLKLDPIFRELGEPIYGKEFFQGSPVPSDNRPNGYLYMFLTGSASDHFGDITHHGGQVGVGRGKANAKKLEQHVRNQLEHLPLEYQRHFKRQLGFLDAIRSGAYKKWENNAKARLFGGLIEEGIVEPALIERELIKPTTIDLLERKYLGRLVKYYGEMALKHWINDRMPWIIAARADGVPIVEKRDRTGKIVPSYDIAGRRVRALETRLRNIIQILKRTDPDRPSPIEAYFSKPGEPIRTFDLADPTFRDQGTISVIEENLAAEGYDGEDMARVLAMAAELKHYEETRRVVYRLENLGEKKAGVLVPIKDWARVTDAEKEWYLEMDPDLDVKKDRRSRAKIQKHTEKQIDQLERSPFQNGQLIALAKKALDGAIADETIEETANRFVNTTLVAQIEVLEAPNDFLVRTREIYDDLHDIVSEVPVPGGLEFDKMEDTTTYKDLSPLQQGYLQSLIDGAIREVVSGVEGLALDAPAVAGRKEAYKRGYLKRLREHKVLQRLLEDRKGAKKYRLELTRADSYSLKPEPAPISGHALDWGLVSLVPGLKPGRYFFAEDVLRDAFFQLWTLPPRSNPPLKDIKPKDSFKNEADMRALRARINVLERTIARTSAQNEELANKKELLRFNIEFLEFKKGFLNRPGDHPRYWRILIERLLFEYPELKKIMGEPISSLERDGKFDGVELRDVFSIASVTDAVQAGAQSRRWFLAKAAEVAATRFIPGSPKPATQPVQEDGRPDLSDMIMIADARTTGNVMIRSEVRSQMIAALAITGSFRQGMILHHQMRDLLTVRAEMQRLGIRFDEAVRKVARDILVNDYGVADLSSQGPRRGAVVLEADDAYADNDFAFIEQQLEEAPRVVLVVNQGENRVERAAELKKAIEQTLGSDVFAEDRLDIQVVSDKVTMESIVQQEAQNQGVKLDETLHVTTDVAAYMTLEQHEIQRALLGAAELSEGRIVVISRDDINLEGVSKYSPVSLYNIVTRIQATELMNAAA